MTGRPIHFQVTYVKASGSVGRIAASSTYIRRCGERKQVERSPICGAESYVSRSAPVFEGEADDLAALKFFCRGSHRSADVWAAVDKAFRTKSGEYSRRGGSPRMALFIDATLPRQLSEKQKLLIGSDWAETMINQYGVCIEAAWHLKGGVIDHIHFLVSTRTVDEDGVGPIVRAFNGISSKCSTAAIVDGKKKIAAHMEFMRTQYANLLTRETGELYDPRSYERQCSGIKPVPFISRARIEKEKKRGVETWRDERNAMIVARELFAGKVQGRIDLLTEAIPNPRLSSQKINDKLTPTPDETFGIPMAPASNEGRAPSLKPLLDIVALATPIEHHGRLREQHAAPLAARPLERVKPEDLYAEIVRQVDEQNRREAAEDMQQKAQPDASQKPHSAPSDLARCLPPPLRPQTRIPFGTIETRKAITLAAKAVDSAINHHLNRVLVEPSLEATRSDARKIADDTTTNMSDRVKASAEPKAAERCASVDISAPLAKHPHSAESSRRPTFEGTKNSATGTPDAVDYIVRHLKARLAQTVPVETRPSSLADVHADQAVHTNRERPADTPRGKPASRGTPPAKDSKLQFDRLEGEQSVNSSSTMQQIPKHEKPKTVAPDPASSSLAGSHDRTFATSSRQRELLIRLAALLQVTKGGLVVHRGDLAGLARMELSAFARAVAIQSAANAALSKPLGTLKRQLVDEIEAGGLAPMLATALKALSARPTTARKRLTNSDRSQARGPSLDN